MEQANDGHHGAAAGFVRDGRGRAGIAAREERAALEKRVEKEGVPGGDHCVVRSRENCLRLSYSRCNVSAAASRVGATLVGLVLENHK